MISKELLSEVLEISDINLVIYDIDFPNIIEYTQYANLSRGMRSTEINIYELAHRCKEWASGMGYDLYSYRFDSNASYAYLDLEINGCYPTNNGFSFSGNFLEEFEAVTEPEAIFEACQWILEQRVKYEDK